MQRWPGRVAEAVRSFPTSRKALKCSDERPVSPHCGFSHPIYPELVEFAHKQGSETLLTSVAKTRAPFRIKLGALETRLIAHLGIATVVRERQEASRIGVRVWDTVGGVVRKLTREGCHDAR